MPAQGPTQPATFSSFGQGMGPVPGPQKHTVPSRSWLNSFSRFLTATSGFKEGMCYGLVVGCEKMAQSPFSSLMVLSLEIQIPKALTRALREMETEI